MFRNPETGEEIARVRNLKELQNILFAVPAESFLYHISRNHVSRWLYSRAMFPVAEFLKPITWTSLQDVDAHRRIIFEAIVKYRKMKNQGVVAVFRRDRFDRYSNFARIGDGSLGGKGRGLAFIDNMVKRHPEFEEFENARVAIPKTVVLCTDVFDEFMETNNLYQVALSDADDDTILRYFLKAKLPDRLVEDFFHLLRCGEIPDCHPFIFFVGRFSLSAVCWNIQYVYDSLSGRPLRNAPYAFRCDQRSLCVGLLQRQ